MDNISWSKFNIIFAIQPHLYYKSFIKVFYDIQLNGRDNITSNISM